MEFRHSGNGGNRRRRVLFEDPSSDSDSTTATPRRRKGAGGPFKYANAARAECEVRLADLIPQRAFSLITLWLFGLILTTSLVTLHQQHRAWAQLLGLSRHCFSIFDLSTTSNLSSWVSSSALALAAFTAVLIYRLRRHLVDDYRGRYRVWLWAAMLLLVGSANCSAGFERLVTSISIRYSGTTLWGDGYVWWIVTAVTVALPLAVMLLIDMRHSFLACVAMLLAVSCYGIGGALRLGLLHTVYPSAGALQVVATTTAAHLGHLMVLMSLWTFARYVLLGAQGKLSTSRKKGTVREKRSAARTRIGSESKTRNKTQIETAGGASKYSRRSDLDSATSTTTRYDTSLDDKSQDFGGSKLSKADRRRIRKQARRQGRAA